MNKSLLVMHRILLLVFLLTTACTNSEDLIITKPNIIFVLIDDLGWKDLGIYGSEFYETENIDNLASEGILFTNAYSSSPVCSPTRASIMTGKYPSRIGITDWIPGADPQDRKLIGPQDLNHLPLKEITIAEILKDNGYKTFFAGKWHLGGEGFFPEQQGFDYNFGGHHMGQPPGGYYSPYDNPKLKDGPDGEYLTDRLTDEALIFMENNQHDPFFLFLSYYTVHTPIQPNKRYIGKFRDKLKKMGANKVLKENEHNAASVQNQVNPEYASMIYALDQNFGRLKNKLKELRLYDDALIVFTSDNGGLSTLPINIDAPTSVKPLRAGKGWCYEGGTRVPLIIKNPGRTKGITVDFPVISNDFYPTILEITGLNLQPDQQIDGKSLVPLLNGESEIDREAIFWHFPHYHGSMWTPGSALRKGNWKLIKFYDLEKVELYDLSIDLGEKNDLSLQYPEKTEELLAILHDMLNSTDAELPKLNMEIR